MSRQHTAKSRKRAKPPGKKLKSRLRKQISKTDADSIPISHPLNAADAHGAALGLFSKTGDGEFELKMVSIGGNRLSPKVSHQLVSLHAVSSEEWHNLEVALEHAIPEDQRQYIEAAGKDFVVTTLFGVASAGLDELEKYLTQLIHAGETFLTGCTSVGPPDDISTEINRPIKALPDNLEERLQMAANVFGFDGHPLLSPFHTVTSDLYTNLPNAQKLIPILYKVTTYILEFLEERLAAVRTQKSRKGAKGDGPLEAFLARLLAAAARSGAPLRLPSKELKARDPLEGPTPVLIYLETALQIWRQKGADALTTHGVEAADESELIQRWKKAAAKTRKALLEHAYAARAQLTFEEDA